MVATVHSDPYAIFLRKIGYSVGLELTAERVDALVSQYLRDRDLTVAGWNELVVGKKEEGNWGREKSAEKHIGDFFYSLRLIQRTTGDVLVLEYLDALAIVTEILKDKRTQRVARDFILLWAILINDGEIFVNLLLAEFEEQQIKSALSAMIRHKRTALASLLRGKETTRRINRVINIERQETNKGSAGVGQSVASLKRTEPLQRDRAANRAVDNEAVEFSDDYFRKVPPRRRDWARSLGLWDNDKGLTQRGHDFINGLRGAGYIGAQGVFIFWPMDYELVRSGFRPDLFSKDTKNLWNCLVDFGNAYAGLTVKSLSDSDTDTAVDAIEEMMKVYRSLHVRKAMLRRELPVTIAYPVIVALACAQDEPVLDLPAAIAAEQKGARRRLALRLSRNTGGALSTKR